MFSCLQCESFELHNERTAQVVKHCGACKYPQRSSKESREVTGLFALKVTGKARPETSLSEHKAKRKKGGSIGGLYDKKALLKKLFQAAPEVVKSQIIKDMKEKYPEMSDAYCTTLYYQVKKEVKAEAEAPSSS